MISWEDDGFRTLIDWEGVLRLGVVRWGLHSGVSEAGVEIP